MTSQSSTVRGPDSGFDDSLFHYRAPSTTSDDSHNSPVENQQQPLVTLPPPSGKGWDWLKGDNGRESEIGNGPKWITFEPKATEVNKEDIQVLVQLNDKQDSLSCVLALPALSNTKAAYWADSTKLSDAFAGASKVLDTINPKALLAKRSTTTNRGTAKGQASWPHRACNSMMINSGSESFQVAETARSHVYRLGSNFDKLQTGEHCPQHSNPYVQTVRNNDHRLDPKQATSLYKYLQTRQSEQVADMNSSRGIQ